jgi:hypothetical protein
LFDINITNKKMNVFSTRGGLTSGGGFSGGPFSFGLGEGIRKRKSKKSKGGMYAPHGNRKKLAEGDLALMKMGLKRKRNEADMTAWIAKEQAIKKMYNMREERKRLTQGVKQPNEWVDYMQKWKHLFPVGVGASWPAFVKRLAVHYRNGTSPKISIKIKKASGIY